MHLECTRYDVGAQVSFRARKDSTIWLSLFGSKVTEEDYDIEQVIAGRQPVRIVLPQQWEWFPCLSTEDCSFEGSELVRTCEGELHFKTFRMYMDRRVRQAIERARPREIEVIFLPHEAA